MATHSTVPLFAKIESLSRLWARYSTYPSSTDPDVRYAVLDECSDGALLDTNNSKIRNPKPKGILEALSTRPWNSNAVLFKSSFIARRGRSIFVSCLHSLLPSFWRPACLWTKPRKLHNTSYLDGLRGVAALIVVIHHYTLRFTPYAPYGWHSDQERDGVNWFMQLPIIRVVHSGGFMVSIFFTISGYVLSYRGLKLAREGKPVILLDSLASSVFRRWIRLHLPTIASCFTAFLLTRANLWTNLPADWEWPPQSWTSATLPAAEGTLMTQLWDWCTDTASLCNPIQNTVGRGSKYNINNLWTIPAEWMNSMLVFVTVLGIARTKTWVKVSVLSLLICCCHQECQWMTASFLNGVLLAEISFIQADHSELLLSIRADYFDSKLPLLNSNIHRYTLPAYLFLSRFLWTALFIIGIFIGSIPLGASSSPGYITLTTYTPRLYRGEMADGINFWQTVGSFIVLYSLENASHLQLIFTTTFAQYLGDISFSLYLLHAQVEFTLGQWIVPKCIAITGGWANGQIRFIAGIGLASLAFVPVTFWASDLFTRAVDKKSVNFARWFTQKCFDGL